MHGDDMGKEKQEYICFQNLRTKLGGKYVSEKLRDFRYANVVGEWKESPDFVAEFDGVALAVEHFTVDQVYYENRSANKVINENMEEMYTIHHEALVNGEFDEDAARRDVEENIQYGIDSLRQFDYEICINQFERIFDKHVNKIPRYMERLNLYSNIKLYFLIEVNPFFITNRGGIVKFNAVRSDGCTVSISGNEIIITANMLEIIRRQVGVLDGVIIQLYSYLNFNKTLKSMIYLDLTSENGLKECIKKQRIVVYKSYSIYPHQINFKINIENGK